MAHQSPFLWEAGGSRVVLMAQALTPVISETQVSWGCGGHTWPQQEELSGWRVPRMGQIRKEFQDTVSLGTWLEGTRSQASRCDQSWATLQTHRRPMARTRLSLAQLRPLPAWWEVAHVEEELCEQWKEHWAGHQEAQLSSLYTAWPAAWPLTRQGTSLSLGFLTCKMELGTQ